MKINKFDIVEELARRSDREHKREVEELTRMSDDELVKKLEDLTA